MTQRNDFYYLMDEQHKLISLSLDYLKKDHKEKEAELREIIFKMNEVIDLLDVLAREG